MSGTFENAYSRAIYHRAFDYILRSFVHPASVVVLEKLEARRGFRQEPCDGRPSRVANRPGRAVENGCGEGERGIII